MKNLIAVRHGAYSNSTGRLTHKGHGQVSKLGEFIADMGENFQIVTSPVPRALQTAERLAIITPGGRAVKIWYELINEYDELFPGQAAAIHKRVGQIEKAMQTEGIEDDLVLVGHQSLRDYVEFYMRNSGRRSRAVVRAVAMGRAIQLDLTQDRPEPIYLP